MRPITVVRVVIVAVAIVFISGISAGQPPVLGQKDTFESGTLLNWSQGGAANPANLRVVPGGPTGSTQYMQVISDGLGANGRLTAFNQAQWTGNYNLNVVNTIQMDLRYDPVNQNSPANLQMRVSFKDATGNGYSSDPFTLPNDGVWRHTSFELSAAKMTAVGAPAAFDQFMTGVTEMRVLHATAADLRGSTVVAMVGVDNIELSFTPVPEPAGVLLVAFAGYVVVRRRLRRRSQALTAEVGGGHE